MDWSMPDEYWRTTWHHWLPEGPWMMLAMTVGTATHHGIDGSLQQVVDTICGEKNAELPRCGPLDGPLRWADSEDPEDIAEATERERAFTDVLEKAGHPMPTTVQELADLLVELGVLTHTREPERWRLALPLPLISNTLPIPEEARGRERWVRDYWDHKGSNQTVLDWIMDNVPDQEQEEVGEAPATLRQMSADCDLPVEEVRYGLALMEDAEDVTVLRYGQVLDRDQVFALKDHQRFHVRMDWKAFGETRMVIQAAPGELDQLRA